MSAEKIVDGKSFFITGAAQGLGKGFAEKFLEKGAKFIYIVDYDEILGKQTEQELLKNYPNRVLFIKCDVTKEKEVIEAFKVVEESGFGLDVVINNAGILNDTRSLQEVDINMRGLVQSSLLAWNKMRKDKGGNGGTIVNVSSILGIIQHTEVPVYCGTKAGVLMFSRCLGLDSNYSKTKVRVLTMCFGRTATNLTPVDVPFTIDNEYNEELTSLFINQSIESAVNGMLHMFEHGPSASVWKSENDKQAIDITEKIQKAYETMYTI